MTMPLIFVCQVQPYFLPTYVTFAMFYLSVPDCSRKAAIVVHMITGH